MEKRISMLPHKPHATSQPSRFSRTPRLSTDSAHNHMCPSVGLFCLWRGGVGLEYDLVSLGLHYFMRLANALYCRSGRCVAGVAFSV